MTEDTEKRQLDIQVMSKMRDLGVFDHLNSRFLSDFAVAVQNSDLDSLKMYKDVKQTTDFQIAADFVIQYLKNNQLDYTLKCLTAETNDKIVPPPNITKDELNFTTNNYLDEALKMYLNNDQQSEIKKSNHEQFRQALAQRLESIE